MYSKITNKLNYARETNPLYNNFNDDEVLTLTYDRYYKDKIGFEDYKKQMLEPMDFLQQNKMALRFYNERKNITQQDIKDYKLMLEKEALEEKGEIGFVEGLSEGITKNYGLGFVPFLGSFLEGYQNDRLNEINLKASKGIKLTDEEQELFNKEIKDFKEKSIRGYSIGGQIGAGVVPSFRFMGEYWATSKLFGGNPILMALNPTAIYNEYQARQLEGDLLITDKGEVFLNDLQQKPVLKTLLKSYGSVFVSNFTEQLGGKIISPVLNKITPIFDNAAKKVFGENTINAVRKVGFDGFIEETFEEYIEKPLSFALGITDEEYTLENFLKSFEMSLDEFLVITGSVAIQGGISYSGAKLIEKLKGSGLNQKQINNIFKNTTELEKESFLKRLEDIENINEEKTFNEYLDNLGKQIVDSGLSEKDAENEKKLLNTIMTNRAVREGKSRIDILNNYRLEEVRRRENDVKNISKNDVENDIETFYQKNTEARESIEELIEAKNNNKNISKILGKLNKEQIDFLNNNGINVNNETVRILNTNTLRHINNRHGKNNEQDIKQKEITDNDIRNIPYIIANPDYIEVRENKSIRFIKEIDNNTNYYIEAFLDDKNKLIAKTMWIKKGVEQSPTMHSGKSTPSNILTLKNKNVKEKNKTLQQETKGQIDLGNNTYYQSINNDLELNQEIEILSIKNLLNNNKNITKEDAKKLIEEIANNGEQIKTLSEPWVVDILNDNYRKKHIIYSSRNNKLLSKDKIRRNIELNNLKDIINNSILIERINNIKEIKKPNVEEYFYFYTPITDGKNIYLIKSVAEKLKGEKDLRNVHLYDMFDLQIGTVPQTDEPFKGGSLSLPDKVSIKYILQNVKDFYGNNALDSYIAENQDILQQETKGQIDLGQEGAIITLFEKADHSTLIHETGHYFLRFIEMMANNGSNISIKELETIRKFLGNNGESFTIRQQEKFARTFEQYVRRGIAPSNDLKLVFEDYKEWLTDIYKTSKELKANINKDIIDFFDGFIIGRDNNTYYQSINNDLELNQEVDILDISNSIKGKITKDKIKQKIQELIDKKEPIKTLSEPWMIDVLNKKKHHILHGAKILNNVKDLKLRDKQLLNIDNLIKNSILVETVDNVKKDKKPNIDKYLYFYTPIKDNNNIYLVKLFTEQRKNSEENVVDLYDIITVKELSTGLQGNKTPLSNATVDNSKLSIKDILQNVKDFYGNNTLDSYVKENIENTTLYQDIANNNNINTSEEVYNKNINIQINNNNRINKVKDYINNKKEMIGSTLEGTFMLSEDIIRRIGGEDLLSFIKRYEARKMIKSNEYNNKLMGFYENMRYLKKNNINDYYTYDLALKNSDLNKIIELSEKYEDINLYENYLQLRDVLDEFHELELSVGIDVGFIENYIPRQIKDLDGLLSTLRNESIEDFNRIQKDLETAEKEGQILTEEDKIRVVNNFMAGFRSPIYAKTGGGNNITKERKIKQLNEKSNPFYETTEKAVANYIARNYDTILQRQFFGRLNKDQGDLFKKLRNKYRQLKKLKETDSHNIKKNEIIKLETKKKIQEITLNNLKKIKDKTKEQEDVINKLEKQIKYLDSSINFYNKIKADTVKNMRNREIEKEINELRDKLDIDNILENSIANYVNSIDHINSKDATLLKNTILYVLNPATTSGFSSFISNSSYGIALTGFINTIRQFKDLATTFYKNGFFNTINSRKNVDVKDLGLDGNLNDMLGSKGIINRIFKITLFEKVDLFAKSTFLNSAFKKTKKLLLNNDINTIKDIELIFGKDSGQVKEDIKNNNITLDVKSYLLIKLSETQPIFMSSRALSYLKNGNTRFFYSLKTFTLKQLSLYKKDVYDKIVKGKTNNERIEGLKNLITLQFYTMLVGLPVDLLTSFDDDDWLEPEMIKDSVLDNILYLNIINRYVIDRAKTNLGTAAFDFVLGVPLTGLFNGLSRDIYKIQKGDFELEKSGLLRSIAPSRDVLKVLEMGEK